MRGADRETRHLRVLAARPFPDLRRIPTGVLLLERQERLLDLKVGWRE
jgi:hypothetical protein